MVPWFSNSKFRENQQIGQKLTLTTHYLNVCHGTQATLSSRFILYVLFGCSFVMTPPKMWIAGVFAQVAHGLGCTPESAYSCLASLCSPSARPPRAKKGLSARLCSYAKFHRSWRARLRGAQSSRFGGCFELLARLQVESKHNLKTGRLSWAIAPNIREWPDLAWLRLATAWALGRASHDHPSKHALYVHANVSTLSR
jgi:hypothetical protein